MVADFLNALIVQFLAELADRNFEVILFLSSWGPFWGMRTQTRTIESIMVVVGVSVGFITRVVVVSLIGYDDFKSGVFRNIVTVLSPLVLWFLVWRAYGHYSSADALAELEKQRQAVIDEEKNEALAPAPAAMEAGEAGGEDKGKVAPLEVSLPFEAEDLREPKFLAFFVPLVATLLVSISDPLKGSRYAANGGWSASIAICLGSILASTMAVVAGTLLEGYISERRYLLCAAVTMSLSAIAASSRMILFLAFELDGQL